MDCGFIYNFFIFSPTKIVLRLLTRCFAARRQHLVLNWDRYQLKEHSTFVSNRNEINILYRYIWNWNKYWMLIKFWVTHFKTPVSESSLLNKKEKGLNWGQGGPAPEKKKTPGDEIHLLYLYKGVSIIHQIRIAKVSCFWVFLSLFATNKVWNALFVNRSVFLLFLTEKYSRKCTELNPTILKIFRTMQCTESNPTISILRKLSSTLKPSSFPLAQYRKLYSLVNQIQPII